MATTKELNVRLVNCAKTAAQWADITTVPKKGEICIEWQGDSSNVAKAKVGDGVNVYADLPYLEGDFDESDLPSYSLAATSNSMGVALTQDGTTVSTVNIAALPLTGGEVTGSVTFDNGIRTDSISASNSSSITMTSSIDLNNNSISDISMLGVSHIGIADDNEAIYADAPIEYSTHEEPTSDTTLVDKKYVDDKISSGIAASDAMIFKGTIGTSGTVTALPTTYKTGWTYRVITAGTYAGAVCEVGDLIIALNDGTSVSSTINSDWTVAQTNINGAITSLTAGTGISISGSGSSRTINHSNSITAGTAQGDSSKTLAFGGTFTIPTVTYDAQGHITGKGTTTMTMPANPNTSAHIYATGSSGTANATTTNGNTYLRLFNGSTAAESIKIKGSGATTVTSDANGVITVSSTNSDTKVTNTLATTTKAYITGTTSATTNTGAQVFDTGVYLTTTAGTLHATTFEGNATTATTATKLGSSTVGGTAKPIYLNAGTATALSATVGGSEQPVYLNAGTITAVTGVNVNYLTQTSGDTLILDGNFS